MSIFKKYFQQAFFFVLGDFAAIFSASFLVHQIFQAFILIDITYPLRSTLLFAVFSLTSLGFFNAYKINWRFTSIRELLFIVLGLTSALILTSVTIFLAGLFSAQFFYGLILLFLISILFVGAFRISKRILNEVLRVPVHLNRAVIFGAGNAADQLLRDLSRHHHWNLNIVGIFDDNPDLHGLVLHGNKVLGDRKKLFSFLRISDIDELIVAIPSLEKRELKKLIEEVQQIIPNLKVKVLPSFHLLSNDPVRIQDVRNISILDILGREPVKADLNAVEESIRGKKILITGAGGSIGSELVRQCTSLKPEKLVALDVDETELFHLLNELDNAKSFLSPCVANITDEAKLRQILDHFTPDIIFHAAAYKHVPMMEAFPEEAIKVNIGGTRLLSRLSIEYGVKKFVLISTDKAVNPTNVMGATKRVAEEIVIASNETAETKFMAVRFGNVLGSRGSVVPIFMKQIRNGGPLTITHKDIVRYFMTIPEAVLLVMQSGMMGEGGEVFVLDMGEPVRIDDMARQLIRLHGLEPDRDIEIEYTGLRPGEKMFEELLKSEERVESTSHKLITKAICTREITTDELQIFVDQLLNTVKNGSTTDLRSSLRNIVPNYSFKKEPFFTEVETIG